jgi:hypothetical protein
MKKTKLNNKNLVVVRVSNKSEKYPLFVKTETYRGKKYITARDKNNRVFIRQRKNNKIKKQTYINILKENLTFNKDIKREQGFVNNGKVFIISNTIASYKNGKKTNVKVPKTRNPNHYVYIAYDKKGRKICTIASRRFSNKQDEKINKELAWKKLMAQIGFHYDGKYEESYGEKHLNTVTIREGYIHYK